MPKEEPNIIITSESKKVRVWDMRQAYYKGALECLIDPEIADVPSK
jgi:hypothetical protein